jgi:hypothetical protein
MRRTRLPHFSTILICKTWVIMSTILLLVFVSRQWFSQYFSQITFHCYRDLSKGESYGSWIYNYLCNQCISPLTLWVRISIRARCTTLCDKVCQWLVAGRWFSLSPPVSSTNKTDRHAIPKILLKVSLSTITLTCAYSPLFFLFFIIEHCFIETWAQ